MIINELKHINQYNKLNNIFKNNSLNRDKLNQIDFIEQEKMRDKLKIKYYIEKFLNKENISEKSKYFIFFTKTISNMQSYFFIIYNKVSIMAINDNDKSLYEKLTTKFKSFTRPRTENIYYTTLRQIINQKKIKQKILKLEDFIDEIYLNDSQPFKTMIQTKQIYSNLVDDFFQFNHFLVYY